MDTEFLSHQFLDKIMEMSPDTRKKYSEALTLIINQGIKPERAFQEMSFIEAFERERGERWGRRKN